MKSRILISILLLAMFVVTGCTSKSLEEAQVDFCQALVAYGEAVGELQNVNDGTTVEELQSARDDAADDAGGYQRHFWRCYSGRSSRHRSGTGSHFVS
jgi:hypothetical protein